jgi:hypothetical protein
MMSRAPLRCRSLQPVGSFAMRKIHLHGYKKSEIGSSGGRYQALSCTCVLPLALLTAHSDN